MPGYRGRKPRKQVQPVIGSCACPRCQEWVERAAAVRRALLLKASRRRGQVIDHKNMTIL